MYFCSTWPNNHLNHLISAKGEEGLGWWSSAKGGRIASCWGQSQSFDQNKIEIGTKSWWIGRFGGKREKGKLHIFLEGQKILRNLHLTKVRWRFLKILWPFQNFWNLCTIVQKWKLIIFLHINFDYTIRKYNCTGIEISYILTY